ILNGQTEYVVNDSTATGIGLVILNPTQDKITVELSWNGLTAPASAVHIHGPGFPGTNSPVIFAMSGVPAVTSGALPEQTFNISPTQLGYLNAGSLYLNVKDENFPGGEIRGQCNLGGAEDGFVAVSDPTSRYAVPGANVSLTSHVVSCG